MSVERGEGVSLGARVQLDADLGGRIVLGDGCSIGDGCRLLVRGGVIEIGAGARLDDRCTLLAQESITVGAGATLGDGAMAVDFDHETADVETPIRLQGLLPSPVAIGPRARLGPGACVMRGITIGEDAEVGAHAVVTHDVPAGSRVEGVPARPVERERPPAAHHGATT